MTMQKAAGKACCAKREAFWVCRANVQLPHGGAGRAFHTGAPPGEGFCVLQTLRAHMMPRRSLRRAATRWRAALCTALLALLCGCAGDAAPADDGMPPLPELTLSRSAGRLAVDLVDTAGLQNVFKLTYGEMTDLYELVIDPFHELIVYIPGAGGTDALFLGVLTDRETLFAAQQELDFLMDQLRETNPALPDPQMVTRGRYILYICAEAPAPALAMFEHALVWRA